MAHHNFSRHKCAQRGFSLVELVAVTGIIVILSSIVLVNNNKFGGAIQLRNLAYDLALTIRQAQTYGIAVRKFGSGVGQFGGGYGMYFDISVPSTYTMYADVVAINGLYDSGELVDSPFTIGGGYKIYDLCVTPVTLGAQEECGKPKLQTFFIRPEPDAYVRINTPTPVYQRGRVILESPRGDRLAVLIEATGQISVQAAP